MPVLEKGKSMAKAIALPGDGGEQNKLTGFVGKTTGFLRDVRGELRKVVTPSAKEVRATTTVVIVAVFAFAAYFYVVDNLVGRGIGQLLRMLGGTQ